MRYEAIITFDSHRGFYFAVTVDENPISVFVHQTNVENQRALRVDDRVSFELAPSRTLPGKMEAAAVRYLGHLIARQVGGRRVPR
jgi:cold shock CspA family protein